ncbi:hypothetical protein B0I31_110296 [Saccharothrix carnea]|uniref:Uncharacterized protein n=1 Tax=Saccharothrix carnea TaxID=1280637 RepID=A0A2P8I413_SACCR|nr:hypothetical protein [Saccharothrix carnea]PSL53203.1 hypothetical protein B0I31_110296 [Saccharothrix carnea]
MSRRLLGAVLLVVAGVAAVVATFLPLFWQGSVFRGERIGFTTTSWKIVSDRVSADSEAADFDLVLSQTTPQFGVSIVGAALLLALAAALVALPEVQRLAARYVAVAGTALLAGSVWTTGTVVAAAVDEREADPDAEPRNGPPLEELFIEEVGEGVWVLVAAVVIAVVGTVLLHARRPEPRPAGVVVYRVDDDLADTDDTDTPPFGIPVVEVAQLPEPEHDRR